MLTENAPIVPKELVLKERDKLHVQLIYFVITGKDASYEQSIDFLSTCTGIDNNSVV